MSMRCNKQDSGRQRVATHTEARIYYDTLSPLCLAPTPSRRATKTRRCPRRRRRRHRSRCWRSRRRCRTHRRSRRPRASRSERRPRRKSRPPRESCPSPRPMSTARTHHPPPVWPARGGKTPTHCRTPPPRPPSRTRHQSSRPRRSREQCTSGHGRVIDVRLNELFRLVVIRSEGPDEVVDSALDHDGRTPRA